jgi:hypothetical protein
MMEAIAKDGKELRRDRHDPLMAPAFALSDEHPLLTDPDIL